MGVASEKEPRRRLTKYERERQEFLENWFGNQVDKCPHCRSPKLRSFVCQSCGKDPDE